MLTLTKWRVSYLIGPETGALVEPDLHPNRLASEHFSIAVV